MSGTIPSIILATSNGTGMGHLARQLAVGKAAAGDARVTLFSLSVALPTVTRFGIPGEYCSGPDRGWIPASAWDQYLAARLTALIEEVTADVVVFDGVAPYRGVSLARVRNPQTAFVWFRRGMWKSGVNTGQLWKSALFDSIIEPGDLAAAGDRGATADRKDALRVPPVSLVEVFDQLPRNEAAETLGLDPNRPTFLLTLGSGRLGDVQRPGSAVLDTILKDPQAQVAIATSAIARNKLRPSHDPRVIEILGVFPLVQYLNAFDAVVSAAGYNAVHEYIGAGVPTLLVPNRATRTDDQVRRAELIASRGLAITAREDSPSGIEEAAHRLMDPVTRSGLRASIASLSSEERVGGAEATSRALITLGATHVPAPLTMRTRILRARDNSKAAIKRRIGPRGVNRVRRLLGRQELGEGGRMRVTLGDDPPDAETRRLTVTSNPDVQLLLGDDPVEHMLEGSSAAYQSERRLTIEKNYEVVD